MALGVTNLSPVVPKSCAERPWIGATGQFGRWGGVRL